MQPGGGAFLIAAGLGILSGAVMGENSLRLGFQFGALAGLVGIIVAGPFARKRFGAPTKAQISVMLSAVAFEFAVVYVLFRFGGASSWTERDRWLAILAVVAAHFIVMRWSFGPLILTLGLSVLLWLAATFVLGLPLLVIATVYGALLVIFGALMMRPLLIARQL
jgi:hypothetical protein